MLLHKLMRTADSWKKTITDLIASNNTTDFSETKQYKREQFNCYVVRTVSKYGPGMTRPVNRLWTSVLKQVSRMALRSFTSKGPLILFIYCLF